MKQPKTIVITGAESTGKSTLTQALANHLKAPFVPEIARHYVENLDRNYHYSDIEIIAKEQVFQYEKQKASNPSFIIMDTWLIITKVWFDEVYKKTPAWIDEKIRSIPIDLFLICDTDLPWVDDPVRENGGESRIYLQNKYIKIIQKFNFNFEIVSGKYETRLNNAVKFVEQLI